MLVHHAGRENLPVRNATMHGTRGGPATALCRNEVAVRASARQCGKHNRNRFEKFGVPDACALASKRGPIERRSVDAVLRRGNTRRRVPLSRARGSLVSRVVLPRNNAMMPADQAGSERRRRETASPPRASSVAALGEGIGVVHNIASFSPVSVLKPVPETKMLVPSLETPSAWL